VGTAAPLENATQTTTSVTKGLEWRLAECGLRVGEAGEKPEGAGGADAGEATVGTFLRRGLGGPLRLAQADQ